LSYVGVNFIFVLSFVKKKSCDVLVPSLEDWPCKLVTWSALKYCEKMEDFVLVLAPKKFIIDQATGGSSTAM